MHLVYFILSTISKAVLQKCEAFILNQNMNQSQCLFVRSILVHHTILRPHRRPVQINVNMIYNIIYIHLYICNYIFACIYTCMKWMLLPICANLFPCIYGACVYVSVCKQKHIRVQSGVINIYMYVCKYVLHAVCIQ